MAGLKEILNQKLLLEKMNVKGGWTYARVPKFVVGGKKMPVGFKLPGRIDAHELECSLMPLNKDHWFLPLNAGIRKAIGKEAGDHIQLVLYTDVKESYTEADFLLCLGDEPSALANYNRLAPELRSQYLSWIFEMQDDEVQVERMATAIDKLARGEAPVSIKSAKKITI